MYAPSGRALCRALRTLVRQKRVQAHRGGREFSYQLSAVKQAAPATRPAPRVPSLKVRPDRPLAKPDTEAGRELPKLAMGDIVIPRIGDTFVEVATQGISLPATSNGTERVMGMTADRCKRKWARWGGGLLN